MNDERDPRHEEAGEDGKSYPCFLCLWASQTLSLFGSMITQFAVNVWLVRDLYPLPSQKPELAVALTTVGLASFAPLIIAMPVAGAFADRHDKKRILVASNAVLALLSVLLVTLSLTHGLSLVPTALILVAYAVATSFHSAAFDSSYGLFVSEHNLPRAGGLMMTSHALAQLLAPALAATLVAAPTLMGRPSWLPADLQDGVPFAFAADGLTFVIALVVVARLRFPPAPAAPPPTGGILDGVREGFRWILSRRPFHWLLTTGSFANLTFAPLLLLLPLLARDRVAADAAARGMPYEEVLAIANIAGGFGGVLGGIAVSLLGLPRMRRTLIMGLSLVVLGLGEVIAGVSTTVWGLALGMFVGESLVGPLNTASYTLWQTLTPPQMLARALATRRFIAQGAFPLGTAISGWLAVRAEPWVVVAGSGALMAVFATVQMLRPGFATLEDRMRIEAGRPD